jgi:hypothetical protein
VNLYFVSKKNTKNPIGLSAQESYKEETFFMKKKVKEKDKELGGGPAAERNGALKHLPVRRSWARLAWLTLGH